MKLLAILATAVITVIPVHSQTEAVIKAKATDALTESIVIPSGKSVTIASGATITAASGSTVTGFGGTPAWGDITGTPTTLAGYGISDAITAAVAASTYQPLNAKLTSFGSLTSAAGVLTNNGGGTFSYTAASAGGNGATDSGKVLLFDAGGGITATNLSIDTGDILFSLGSTGIVIIDQTSSKLVDLRTDYLEFNTDAGGARTLAPAPGSGNYTSTLPTTTGTIINTGNLSSIIATGTIASGTWQGTAVGIGYGGTGATTASAARIALLPSMTANGGKFLRVNAGATDYELATIGGGGDALVSGSLDQFADVTQTATKTLAITESTTLAGGTHSGTNTGDQTTITGNAGTATALQTGRAINGVTFDGTAAITVTAAAGTLTGGTLASGVTQSSLTSLGTITAGEWQASGIEDAYISSASTWDAKESALTFSTGLTRSVNTVTVNTSQNIATLSNLTSNGFVKTSGGTGTLSIDTATYIASGGALGTPSSGTLTNATGLPLSTGVTGQLPLANGGTGAALSDPNADRIAFWDDSAGTMTWLTAGSGLTITDTTISASGGSGVDVTVVATKGGTDQTDTYTANTYITVAFGTEVQDDGGDFAANTLTVASGEMWLITGAVSSAPTVNAHSHMLALFKDGTIEKKLNVASGYSVPYVTQPFSTIISTAGDYTIRLTYSSTGSRAIEGDATDTYLICRRLK